MNTFIYTILSHIKNSPWFHCTTHHIARRTTSHHTQHHTIQNPGNIGIIDIDMMRIHRIVSYHIWKRSLCHKWNMFVISRMNCTTVSHDTHYITSHTTPHHTNLGKIGIVDIDMMHKYRFVSHYKWIHSYTLYCVILQNHRNFIVPRNVSHDTLHHITHKTTPHTTQAILASSGNDIWI